MAQDNATTDRGRTRRNLKTSEIVALDIVRDIVGRALKPGDRLPLEAEMLVQYGVSRSSLREALRLLETQGLIKIRPGPGAGTIVAEPSPRNLGRTMTLYFHLANVSYRTGRKLTFSPETETFLSDGEANMLLARNYRTPFVVPASV